MNLTLILGSLLVIFGTHAVLTYARPQRHRPVPSPRLPPKSSSRPPSYDPHLQQRLVQQIAMKHSPNDQESLKENLISQIPVDKQTQESRTPEQTQQITQQLDQNLEQKMHQSLETFQNHTYDPRFRVPRDHGHPQGPSLGIIERDPMRLPVIPSQISRDPPQTMSAGLEYDEPSPTDVQASNESLAEASVNFESQFTDVARYFSQHPRELMRDLPRDTANQLFGPSPPQYLRAP